MIYNEHQIHNDRNNDHSARYLSPLSPMDSLMASCPGFDMTNSPSLQDSTALPSYRVQFGPELSTLLDENDRGTTTLSSSVPETFSGLAANEPSSSFPMSFLDGNVFADDSYSSPFGPMLVHNPNNELSWPPRSLAPRENSLAQPNNLCLSPYAISTDASYGISTRGANNEYMCQSSFETLPGESVSSSETDSLPRTPETVAPSAAFGNYSCLVSQPSSQKRGTSWEHASASASSSFLDEDVHDSLWKGPLGIKSRALHDNLNPEDLRQLGSARRASNVRRKRAGSTRTSSERGARLHGAFGTIECEIPVEHVNKPGSRCDECNQNFQRPEHLTRHKKSASHTRETPFQCELPRCLDKKTGKRKCFNRQDNKTAHIVKTHLTPAAKGRRDRVTEEEARVLGWEKYFAAARKEQRKQDEALTRQNRGGVSNSDAGNGVNGVNNARIAKKSLRRHHKMLG